MSSLKGLNKSVYSPFAFTRKIASLSSEQPKPR
jgi:hypothetical protein